jgi:hypothetical protein
VNAAGLQPDRGRSPRNGGQAGGDTLNDSTGALEELKTLGVATTSHPVDTIARGGERDDAGCGDDEKLPPEVADMWPITKKVIQITCK